MFAIMHGGSVVFVTFPKQNILFEVLPVGIGFHYVPCTGWHFEIASI